jgi:Zn-dependent protease
MPNFDPGQLIIYMVVLVFSISAHEAAHAWMSYKFGDDTAYLLGRVTLNPVSHTDPIGTLLIPIFNFVFAGSGLFLIGWGKPTPVNPLKWTKKDLANVMVSSAGIIANIIIAIVAFILIKVLNLPHPKLAAAVSTDAITEPLSLILYMFVMLNASLAVFNLLPLPPLDGSKILETFLPRSAEPVLLMLEQYSFIILMALIYIGVVGAIFYPISRMIIYFLYGF